MIWATPSVFQALDEESGPRVPGALTFGSFSYDPHGAWFAGRGRVWLVSDGGGVGQFKVGPAEEMVFPAGPCS